MKKALNKIKATLSALGIAMISFSSKIFGQEWSEPDGSSNQTVYGVERPMQTLPSPTLTPIMVTKIVQIGLIAIIFIVGIINFIRIKKIDDKTIKRNRIRNTIIIISILILLLVASFIIPARLLTR